MRPVTANALSTLEVRSPAGENVGNVVDFVLDLERGTVVYAVLAAGGVLGASAKMLAIPPESLRFDARRLTLGIETAKLEEAPGIDRADPPENAGDALAAGVSRQPQPPRTSSPRSQR